MSDCDWPWKHRAPHRVLEAYYFAFESVGDYAIDNILKALALAGKAYHSTEFWHEEHGYEEGPSGESYADLIERAAYSAAEEMRRLKEKAEAAHSLESDVRDAAGELLVPMPEPGTDAAKMLLANRMLARERDEARALLRDLNKRHRLGCQFPWEDQP